MLEDRASNAYKNFIEAYCVFNEVFEGIVSLESVFEMPYPMFNDILLKQINRKKKQKEEFDRRQGKMKAGTKFPAVGQRIK